MAIDHNETKWIGTKTAGLTTYDGTEWTVYNASNSGLPDNEISSIVFDQDSTIWIGTLNGGLATFDGTEWTVYNSSNSGLPHNRVTALAIDHDGVKWIGTAISLAKLDSTDWTVFSTSNSGLPLNFVASINVDEDNTKWFGTGGGGLAIFDDNDWVVYNPTNSGLQSDFIRAMSIGQNKTKWIATGDGLATMNECLDPIDVTVAVDSTTLSSGAEGVTYQWTECDSSFAFIQGATNQYFTATANGNYAVILSVDDLCVDTSDCTIVDNIVGLDETLFEKAHTVYPNPTTGKVEILLGSRYSNPTVSVFNAIGQPVFSNKHAPTDRIQLELPEEEGIYFIKIEERGKGFTTMKVVKK